MRTKRTLSLTRETLSALTSDEMAVVNGGSHACTVGHGPSFDEPCPTPTLPVNPCLSRVTTIIDVRETLVCV